MSNDPAAPNTLTRLGSALAVAAMTVAALATSIAPSQAATGLSCAQMKARSYSYSQAVAYWRNSGYPSRLDADNNGIPCETVYSASSVRTYWGNLADYGGGIPSGLSCKQLVAGGYDYGDALGYWKDEGYPSRMDADNNGIPCETVYSAAEVRKYFRY